MTRTEYLGGLYVDAMCMGERVILYPDSHLETHLGRVDFPPGERYGPMFLGCSNVLEFRFCGLAHDSINRLWEWTRSGGWRAIDGPTSGRTVYDWTGSVRDALPAGYQFLDDHGTPMLRIDTYGPFHGLSEWSATGGVLIGQGHANGGVRIWDGAHLRVLDEGYCVFIRVHRLEDTVTIAYHKGDVGAVIVRTTLSELRALPIEQPSTPDEPDESDEPEPHPMPDIPRELDNQLGLVTEVRNALFPDKIGQPLNNPHKAMLVTYHVAWRLRHLGIGLVRAKIGSANNVDGYTSDIVALASGDHWDIQIDGHTGAAWPRWAKEQKPENNIPIRVRWTPAIQPPNVGEPEPGGTGGVEQPPAGELAALRARVEALEATVLRYGSRIGLRMDGGMAVCPEGGGPRASHQDIHFRTRDHVQAWETFTVEKP